jgi:hypothetical protein
MAEHALLIAAGLLLMATTGWSMWCTWVWEGELVRRGTLSSRRFLVNRGPESYRLPWQSWQKKWGMDEPDPDPHVEVLRRRILLSSRLQDAAILGNLGLWAALALL